MKQTKIIRKRVEQYYPDWPPSDAAGAIAWFQAKLDAVPAEFRETAKIEIDVTSEHGTSYATIEFSYVRPETDEEEAEREQRVAAEAERRRALELRMLAELQTKYGNIPT